MVASCSRTPVRSAVRVSCRNGSARLIALVVRPVGSSLHGDRARLPSSLPPIIGIVSMRLCPSTVWQAPRRRSRRQHRPSVYLAQSGHNDGARRCLLLGVKRTLVGNWRMLETKYKNARAKYKKYIGAISENIKNINWAVVYISGAIQCGAEMPPLAAAWMSGNGPIDQTHQRPS